MDLNQGNSNPQITTGGNDSFVIVAKGIDDVNEKIKQFEVLYILHSMSINPKTREHSLLFHKKNLSIVKELKELNQRVQKLIEITNELRY